MLRVTGLSLRCWSVPSRRLGSRLYYEFTEVALSDGAAWERLADSVAVEVRRHGAPQPSPSSPAAKGDLAADLAVTPHPVGVREAPSAKIVGTTAAPVLAPMCGAVTPGVGVSSVVRTTIRNHNAYANNNISNTTSSNFGNTSLFFA